MFKRLLLLFILTSLLFATGYCGENMEALFGSKTAFIGTQADAKTGVVYNCWRLNVRNGPWGKILDVISVGDIVNIVGSSDNKYWYKISHNGKTAFVSHKHIQVGGQQGAVATGTTNLNSQMFSSKKKGYVNASSLNIRSGPWGTILDNYSYGTDVLIVGKTGDWYKIVYKTGFAFAHSHYIQDGSAPSMTSGGPSGQPGATFTSGPMNKRILDAMRSLKTVKLNYPPACGKHYDGTPATPGNLGCAFAVSTALQRAGVKNAFSLGVSNLSAQLQRKPKPGFKKVPTSSRQPGDIIIWGGHIGVMAEPGKAVSNSSSLSRVREHTDRASKIKYILRAPA